MATPLEQLELMRNLQENWDGYNGAPPEHDVIDLGKEFVGLIADIRGAEGFDGMFVTPGRDGGVLIEWEGHRFEHSIEVNPGASIGLLRVDKATGKMTEAVYGPNEFRALMGSIQDTVIESPSRAA